MASDRKVGSLQDSIDQAGGPLELLRQNPLGAYVFPGIPPEFSNWRDEMRAWKEDVALLEQSYHMCELHLRGAQAIKILRDLALNRLGDFPVKRGKQLVLAGHDGYYLADAIVVHEEDEFYRIVGAPFASDWVQFNAERAGYDIEMTRNDSWAVHQGPRDVFRFQIQGPNALELMRRATDNGLPEIKFFNVGEIAIAGCRLRALRHGMAGEAGFELYGPWAEQDRVRAALEEAGDGLGFRKVGARAYPASAIESAWLAMPIPAIYHSEAMRPYREWLSGYHLEAIGSLGGSLVSDDITDYFLDPIELGYGKLIDWDREFVGSEALKQRRDSQTRAKRTLVWNRDDTAAVMRDSIYASERGAARAVDLPSAMYATFQADEVLDVNGRVGMATWPAYSPNAGEMMSLALMDLSHAEPGTEVTLLWGEPDSKRPAVERHSLREVRATVAPAPYFEKVIKTGKQ